MGIAQITILILMGLSLLIAANQHGKERKPVNFWVTAIAVLLESTLLCWGGFFN
jgi:hypothetical protein